MKKNIAIVWGGYSSEKIVSEKSARGIYAFMDKEKYHLFKVKISKEEWLAEDETNCYPIDKNDFSFVDSTGRKINFHFAYITIHGTPGEDGLLQGYFDMIGLPYSTGGVLSTSLSFNKYVCNNFLKSFGIDVANSMVLREGETYDAAAIIQTIGLPLFVKPNVGGSSFATTKVKELSALDAAITSAFGEASEVMIERFISGTEVTCGCMFTNNKFTVFPLTEVVTHNEFFDYDAKYNGDVDEITPARISQSLTQEIKQITSRIYQLINAAGIIRADYIISDNRPILLEVNATPGMTPTSFIPQQVAAAGLSMRDVLSQVIETKYNH